jgi:hypothetical protein
MKILSSNKGISIIFAVILIVLMGLAGSIFAYLMASGSITSRQNLTSAEAKYAAKSGIEITMYQLERKNVKINTLFTAAAPSGVSCPTSPVIPPGVITLSAASINTIGYIYGNLGNYNNYTSSFCALVAQGNTGGGGGGNQSCLYIITSNGSAGGTIREVTTEVGITCTATKKKPVNLTAIFVENELPNSYP